MSPGQGNFGFLQSHSPQLAKLGVLAERYLHDDPPGPFGNPDIFGCRSKQVAGDIET